MVFIRCKLVGAAPCSIQSGNYVGIRYWVVTFFLCGRSRRSPPHLNDFRDSPAPLRRYNRVVEFSYVELMKGQNCEKAQRGLQHTRGEAPTTEFWPKPDGVPAFAVTSNEGRGESTMSLIKTNNYDYFDTTNECGNERQRLWCRKRRRQRLTERRVWWDQAMIASLRQRSLARGEESFALEAKMFRRRGKLSCLIFQTL